MLRPRFHVLSLATAGLLLACTPADESEPDDSTVDLAAVDAVFADFSGDETPGCAVAVSQDGQTTLTRAYGMANLEWDVPNGGETVFEPGSVSKQFTAAATIMLALDGEIDLDDDIREYLPELPDYGEPIRVRDLITHTSGLRDWGSIAGVEGWARWTRIHSHKHVLDIASRQEALNYAPGEHYSYTNTGYNLQAILIERVTGKSFEEFSQERIFQPLGMTNTQWRDDFTEIVKNRSVAYRPGGEGWHQLMPFENVVGNGGLLTTVGDMLKFTHNLDTGEVGGPRFVEEMHRRGVLDSGREITYAGGLQITEYKGIQQVAHAGSTAGYRGYLARYPDNGLAVSVMCNAANASAGGLAHEVVDIYLADVIQEDASGTSSEGVAVSPETLASYAGTFRDPRLNQVVELTVDDGSLAVALFGTSIPLEAVSETRFSYSSEIFVEMLEGGAAATLETPVSSPVRMERVDVVPPSPAVLAQYAGEYHSEEAEATYSIEVTEDGLVAVNRYGEQAPLEPVFEDAFVAPQGTVVFHRDGAGRVVELGLSQSRVWDLRFRRTR